MRTFIRRVALSLLLLLKTAAMQAQEFPYHELTSENGLPHSLVFDLFQDSRMYTWFATTNGLGKYDGHSFENYYDSDGLNASQVMSVTQTGDGTIWAATYGGGLHYLEDGNFSAYAFPQPGPRPKNIFRMIPGDGNRLYLLDNISNLIIVVDGKKTEAIDMSAVPGLPVRSRHVNTVCALPGSTLWIATDDGLFRRDSSGTIARAFGNRLEARAVFDVTPGPGGMLWIGTRGALMRGNNDESLDAFSPLGNVDYTHVAAGTNETVWTCSAGGEVTAMDIYGTPSAKIDLSSLNGITDLMVDHEGNLWVSTYGSGARCYYNLQVKNYDVNDGLTSNFVRGVFPASDGTVWLSTFNSSSFLSYIRNDSVGQFAFPFTKSQHDMLTIAELEPGKMLFSASNTPLMIREGEKDIRPFFDFIAFDLLPDRQGRLWMAGYNTGAQGIPCLENGELQYVNDPAIANRRILVLKQDNTGNVWAGTDSGLYCFRDKKLLAAFGEREGLPSRTVTDIAVDAANAMWIVTGKGISIVKPGEKNCTTIATAPRGTRYTAITIAPNGTVWAGSSSGLYCFNSQAGLFYPYQKGVQGNEVQDLATDAQNRLWVGTARGVSVLSPGSRSLPAPPVYITQVAVNGISHSPAVAGDWDYSGNTVEIDFTGISFACSKMLTYSYMLKGAGNEWKTVRQPRLLFSNLSPGAYTLYVKALLPDGTESVTPAQFSFRIHPPFWMSSWFITGVILSAGILLYLLFRARLATVRKQAQEKFRLHERMVDLEQQASSAMMHPHFIFNALNSIQNYISKNEQQAAHRYLSRFSKLIRLTLENAYKKRVGLDEELERLELYLDLEKSRYQGQFDYSIAIGPDLTAHDISIPSLIIQPFVENAIWHGIIPAERHGHISISVSAHGPDHIRITIMDDGVGIDSATKQEKDSDAHRSLGIDLTRERMELLGESTGKKASITITDRSRMTPPATGTCVEMIIPRF